MLAGFLRGVENQWELVNDFKGVCEEKIDCQNLISLFTGYSEYVLREMKAQSEFSADSALGILHLAPALFEPASRQVKQSSGEAG